MCANILMLCKTSYIPNKFGNSVRDNRKSNTKVSKSIVRQMIKSSKLTDELKYNNVASNTSASNTVGFADLTSIAVGTSYFTRVGNSVTVKRIILRFNVVLADTTNIFRWAIFIWHCNDTNDTPSAGELLTDVSGATAQSLSPFVAVKPSNFKILQQGIINLDVAHVNVAKELDFPLNHSVMYDPLSSNTGREHIYLMYWSDSGAVSHPSFNYNALIYYSDD